MINGVVERHVQDFSAAHRVVKSDANEKGSFADAMAGYDDSNVSATKSAVDGVFEEPQRVSFIEFFAIHVLLLVFVDQSSAVFLDQLLVNLGRNWGITGELHGEFGLPLG